MSIYIVVSLEISHSIGGVYFGILDTVFLEILDDIGMMKKR